MKKMIHAFFCMLLIIPVNALSQSKAYITIKVNVESVEIYLNGEKIGIVSPDNPLLYEVYPGKHKISAVKEGFKSDSKEIFLESGDTKILTFSLAKPEDWEVDKDIDSGLLGVEYGSLTIAVKRNGQLVPAKVYIDNRYADVAPLSIKKVFVGEHEVKVEFENLSRTIKIKIEKDKNELLDVELITKSRVNINSTLSNTNLMIGGFPNSYTLPYEEEFEKGNYDFRFSKNGYVELYEKLFFDGDNSYKIKVSLLKTLPVLTARDVRRDDRNYYTENNFLKRESYFKPSKPGYVLGGILGFSVGCAVATVIDKSSKEFEFEDFLVYLILPPYCTWGGGLLIGQKALGKEVPIQENIDYNKYEVPKIVKQENRKVDEYNEETARLIKEEQLKRYSKTAIKVDKIDSQKVFEQSL